MAVYTSPDLEEVRSLAERFGLTVDVYQPIPKSVQNSNYLVRLSDRRYVLTIQEGMTTDEALTFGRLLLCLNGHGFRTTRPLNADDGRAVVEFRGQGLDPA